MNASNVGYREFCGRKSRAAAKRRVCARCVFNKKMRPWQKASIKFWIGGIGYGLLEVLWRGETHWSMVLTGGACLLAICALNKRLKKKNIFLCSAVCAAAITAVEFAVGLLVNRYMGLNVWDYGEMFGNVMGQICPLYTFLWFLLCVPISAVVRGIR